MFSGSWVESEAAFFIYENTKKSASLDSTHDPFFVLENHYLYKSSILSQCSTLP